MSHTYYQDHLCRWPFQTNTAGMVNLSKVNDMVRSTLLPIAMRGVKSDAEVQWGETVFRRKPNRRNVATKSATWSLAEYAAPAFQAAFLRGKTTQRFVEVFTILERAMSCGAVPSHPLLAKERWAFVSVGTGPGVDLFACQCFVEQYYGGPQKVVDVEYVGTDSVPSWRPYVEALGYRFEDRDAKHPGWINAGDFMAPPDRVFVVLSYVFDDYVDHEAGALGYMAACLERERDCPPRYVFLINDGHMVMDGTLVPTLAPHRVPLMGIDAGKGTFPSVRDDRQVAFTSMRRECVSPRSVAAVMTYPNVPYQDDATVLGEMSQRQQQNAAFLKRVREGAPTPQQ